jgi:predicted kinase
LNINMKHIKLFEQFISEGVHDPGILKAYFMAGGPGSGKSYVVNQIFGFREDSTSTLSMSTGLKLINSDLAFQYELERMGYEASKLGDYKNDATTWDEVMKLRDKAKNVTKHRMDAYINGRLGMIIDGTGKDYDKITGWATMLKDFGYDVHMIFVNTSLEVAQERNMMRQRTLAPEMVESMWKEVQQNLGRFQNFFKNKMFIVDNSGSDNSTVSEMERIIGKSAHKPVENPIGKKWIKEMSVPDKNKIS